MQPNSRWYTGSGLFRGVMLCHSPRVHVAPDGVFVYTKEVAEDHAFLEAQVEIENTTLENRLVEVSVLLQKEDSEEVVAKTRRIIQVN